MNTLETAGGRGKLEFDLSLAFLSQLEREQLSSPSFMTPTEFRVVLPRRYDAADVGLSSGFMRTSQPDVFELERAALAPVGAEPAWISFPNPSQGALDRAKLLFAFLLGCFALPFQIQPLRDRKLRSLGLIFLLSVAVIAVAGYYGIVLAKRWDFISYTAAAIPSALYALGASIYVVIATRLQAGITGQVQIGGAPAKVVLVRISGEQKDTSGKTIWETLAETASLDPNGRYQFFVWIKKRYPSYKVIASRNKNDIESDVFPLVRRQNHEVPVLQLAP